MQIFKTRATLADRVEEHKGRGRVVGMVPTMGALHEGHLSLVRLAKSRCDIVVVSIFVNPTQFNDPEDLKRYPRTPEADAKLLEAEGCDILFLPTVEEIYPEPDTRVFDFGYIGEVMEGAKRPGHFNGVAQVVSRLFTIVKPDVAFFGRKDFQQIAIVKSMVKQLHFNIEIVSCPIVREEDGLAMSSRNALLDPAGRAAAPQIYRTLQMAVERAASPTGKMGAAGTGRSRSESATTSPSGKVTSPTASDGKKQATPQAGSEVEELKTFIAREIDKNKELKTEYVEIVEEDSLRSVTDLHSAERKVICVAVYCGKIRLIDNITL